MFTWREIWERYQLLGAVPVAERQASWNVAPSQSSPVLIHSAAGTACELMRFGLIPYFAKGVAGAYSTINARVETIATSPAYRGAWKRAQRCLVLANGFYEWHTEPDGKTRTPWYIQLADQPVFAMAGLWDESKPEGAPAIRSFTIVTLPASPLMAQIHNDKLRQPALLTHADCDTWLSGTADAARAVLRQYPDELLSAWPVSRRVNSPKNDDATLIEASQMQGVLL
jgi:putative SOS response-associated peptidase YedK